jgi:hypothetical protein
MNSIRNFLIVLFFLSLISFSWCSLKASEIDNFVIKCTYKNKDVILSSGSLRKTVKFNRVYVDKKVQYYINDINNLDEIEDYILLSNSKGHNIIYPLKCKKI